MIVLTDDFVVLSGAGEGHREARSGQYEYQSCLHGGLLQYTMRPEALRLLYSRSLRHQQIWNPCQLKESSKHSTWYIELRLNQSKCLMFMI